MFDWKKFWTIVGMVASAILAALSAHNSEVVAQAVSADPSAATSMTNLLGTWGTGLGSVASLLFSSFMHWKGGSTVEKSSRAAEIAALGTLAAVCVTRGDTAGFELVSQLAKHLKDLEEVQQPKPSATLTEDTLKKVLENLPK